MGRHILALDQGTTSSRAIVFNAEGNSQAVAQREFPQHLPAPGVVEHNPEEIWESQVSVAREALERAKLTAKGIAAIGIANQRETTILWERDTGRAVAPAIVWQSRVSEPICRRLRAAGLEPLIRERTGLVLDPYFSGSKIRHLLDKHPELRPRAERGEVLFGTVDTYLIWRLTGGRVHATDVTNASRTLLLNLQTLAWDEELLAALEIPRSMLPEVRPTSGSFGETEAEWFGAPLQIAAAVGDQQGAMFGQACYEPGAVKNTYGTGCFMLMNTGAAPAHSKNRLLTTVGWQLADGETVYCLEGSVFVAGAAVQWLRDGLGLIKTSEDVAELACTVPDNDGVYLVPAFVGLGAPYWDSQARGAVFGLTRGATAGHLARAALEAMAFQTRDVLEAMRADAVIPPAELKVDGGASRNNLLMQCQPDIVGLPVCRPTNFEATARGAAWLAGLAAGVWNSTAELTQQWELERRFVPQIECVERERLFGQWRRAVERTQHWLEE